MYFCNMLAKNSIKFLIGYQIYGVRLNFYLPKQKICVLFYNKTEDNNEFKKHLIEEIIE